MNAQAIKKEIQYQMKQNAVFEKTLIKVGVDLKKEEMLDFQFMVPGQIDAALLALGLYDMQHIVTYIAPADFKANPDETDWEVFSCMPMTPKNALSTKVTGALVKLAAECGGTLEGWDMPVISAVDSKKPAKKAASKKVKKAGTKTSQKKATSVSKKPIKKKRK
jgi:hypothetical protein